MAECQNCGAHVSRTYVRVRGINGVVEACPDCDTQYPDRHLRRAPTRQT